FYYQTDLIKIVQFLGFRTVKRDPITLTPLSVRLSPGCINRES
ncbi:hypothetical protein FWK35_00038338, partial [Aphis craccivora]